MSRLTSITSRRFHRELPIHLLSLDGSMALYTPGHIAILDTEGCTLIEQGWQRGTAIDHRYWAGVAAQMEQIAADTVRRRHRIATRKFQPTCLMLQLSNRCQLACGYCYSAAQSRATGALPLALEAACSGARLVAENARERGTAFHLVIHGGGEPSLHPDLIERIVETTKAYAASANIGWHGYIATNGVMHAGVAHRLGELFDVVGLSCDGPPEIQSSQRPMPKGGNSSAWVQSTARSIATAGARLQVRATVTPATIDRLIEIIDYVAGCLRADMLRLEPIYRAHSPAEGFGADDARHFVERWLEAEARAADIGLTLSLSGVRPDELHGPHCALSKDVLLMTPDAAVVNCFACASADSEPHLTVGRWDKETDELQLDHPRIRDLLRRLNVMPTACIDCINAYHCARDCPDGCALEPSNSASIVVAASRESSPFGFRCQIQRLLTEQWLARTIAAHTDVIPHRRPDTWIDRRST
jgi:sulfatase maturation enzyme AslB (radical SAM superfamily)